MSRSSESASTATIVAAIITGIFACIAAVVSLGQPFIGKYADVYFSTDTPIPTNAPLLPPAELSSLHKIAFVDFNGGNNDLYVMDEDGSNQLSLTTGAFVDDYPAWSPDTKYIAFQSGRSGNNEIYIMNSSGIMVNITNNEAEDVQPSWSADGQQIVFQSNRSGNLDLFAVNLLNGHVRQLTNTPNIVEQYPDWSPDGQRIVYAARDASKVNLDIFIMNTDGNNVQNITFGNTKYITPAWSPNGKSIAFSSNSIDKSEKSAVYVINRDGSGLARLTPPELHAVDPDWSPDGQWIIFWGITDEMSESDLYIMRPDGSEIINITNTPNRTEYGPSWAWK